ncbi:hypothetical protein TNCV_5076721 [Trichonephila clavipes]|uniref:Uncharacterized protein n=1 Tax=Trichonephila clavipes TaxID=2585209 RepID=A0A8X6VCL0_TRICX|nr:hypothetical protein TNCV_5076721 [Trichonephila clavipes]
MEFYNVNRIANNQYLRDLEASERNQNCYATRNEWERGKKDGTPPSPFQPYTSPDAPKGSNGAESRKMKDTEIYCQNLRRKCFDQQITVFLY